MESEPYTDVKRIKEIINTLIVCLQPLTEAEITKQFHYETRRRPKAELVKKMLSIHRERRT